MNDKPKDGSRPSHKAVKAAGGLSSKPGLKNRLATMSTPSSPASSATERDLTDDDDDASAGNIDFHECHSIVGKELAVLRIAEQLIYKRTLFEDPFPSVIKLNTWIVEVWEEAQIVLGETKQSAESRTLVRVFCTFSEVF